MQTANKTKTANNTLTNNNELQDEKIRPALLSVVYKKSFLNDILTQTKDKYALVGLLFKKLHGKEFEISKLYYRISKNHAFEQEVIPQNDSGFVEYYLNNTGEKSRFRRHTDMVEITDELKWKLREPNKQNEIKEQSILQFWSVIDDEEDQKLNPLVFFSRYSLDFLLRQNVDRICISGANIDYGVGFYNFGSEGVDEKNKTRYPTLKAEINLDVQNDNKNIPNVAVALPCPPGWGGVKKENINPNLNTTFFSEVISNYFHYKNQAKGIEENEVFNPRSVNQISGDFFGNLAENWNKFLKGNK